MEIQISELESYFGIKLTPAIDDLNDQLQLQTLHQEISENFYCSTEDTDEDQD